MVVVPASGDERRLSAIPLRKFKAQDAAIEGERTIQIRHLQMHMPNADSRIHRLWRQLGFDRFHNPWFFGHAFVTVTPATREVKTLVGVPA